MRIKSSFRAAAAASVACWLFVLAPLVQTQGYCADNDFRCRDGNCIPESALCDKRRDCAGGEDELNCDCEKLTEFRCDKKCIQIVALCDQTPDCLDGTDEINCGYNNIYGPSTDYNECLSEENLCNGVPDCEDGADEAIESCGCETTEFRCVRDNECISFDKRCNGFYDCTDESDEQNCPSDTLADVCHANEFQCENKDCINSEFRCDNHEDCNDGSDERGCKTYVCQDDEWRCGSGECISRIYKCDLHSDCMDNSDEAECPLTTQSPITQPPWTRQPSLYTPAPYTPAPYTPAPYTPAPYTPAPYTPAHRWTPELLSPDTPLSPTESSFVHLIIDDKSQEVKEGEDVVFRCRDHSLQRAKVIWVREGGVPMQPGYNDDGFGRLELRNVTKSDAGNYFCQTVSQPQLSKKMVYLIVNPRNWGEQVVRQRAECQTFETVCNNGKCIPKTAICNGQFDCADGSDELACSAICEPNQFRCGNGRCVLISWRCDSQDDCYDGSDEANCPPTRVGECSSSEFRCASAQCIGKYLHCDGNSDCYDGSDEVGCTSKIYIATPPPRSKFLARGESMIISCTAIGNPPPYVVWRLNWGHIPNKCSYNSDVSLNGHGATVVGTLTCPNVEYEDQGAYSCEALNSKGSLFAVPDTILTVNGSGPVGQKCPTGYFNSQAETEQDCISCFCFGVTTRCKSADLYTYQLPTPLGEGGTSLLGLSQNHLGQLNEQPIDDVFDYQTRFRNEATVTKLVDSTQTDVHPYLGLPESYNGVQLTSYGGYIKYILKPHNRRIQYSNMPDIVIKGKYTTLVHNVPYEQDNYPKAQINVEARLFPQYWSKITSNGIKQASREDIMMALDNIERIMLRADRNGGGVNITNFNMDSAQRENFDLGPATFVEECECPPGYGGLSCHKCKDGYERQASGPWLGLCKRVDEVCPPGTYGEPSRGLPCNPCPCPLTTPSNRFAGTCHLGLDGRVTCNCNPGYEGRQCESCAPGLVGNPTVPGDSCRESRHESRCNPDGTTREEGGRCICKQQVEGTYCDRCTRDSFLLSPDNLHGCAQCFCMGTTDQCGSSDLRRRTITANLNILQDVPKVFWTGNTARYEDPKPANVAPQQSRGEVVLRGLDLSQSQTYYWSLPERFNGNKLTSYGGYLRYTIRHWPTPNIRNLHNTPATVTIFSGNVYTLHNFGTVTPTNDGYLNGSIQLIESNFKRSDGKQMLRSDFLMALADVSQVLIRATYTSSVQETSLASLSMDIADEGGLGMRAVHVEKCRCPSNYVGTSCESCAPGYTRGESIYLASCEECSCNGHSSQCHPETGVCSNCQHNTAGDRCEDCLPGYYKENESCVPERDQAPTGQCRCDPRGEAGQCSSDGRCLCKQNVEGETCNACRPGTFNLDAKNRDGCLSCYCSGVTKQCQAAVYYKWIPMPVAALGDHHGFTLQTIDGNYIINDNFVQNQQYNKLGYIFGQYPPSDRFYWSLPKLPGNRVTSYGGNLMITQMFETGNYEESSDPTINVVLDGNDLTIYWTNNNVLRSGETKSYQVPLRESQWRVLANAGEVTRDEFIKVLSQLRRVLVLASLSNGVTSTYISDVSMDTAIPNPNSEIGNANDVEICQCPPGYQGTSCEQCAAGWYRDQYDVCSECPCNGHADSCQLSLSGVVQCNCRLPYSGRDCTIVDTNSAVSTTHQPIRETTVTVQITKPLIKIFSLGSTVNYTCSARSRITNSPLRVTWKKSEGNLPVGRYYTEDRTGVLLIQNVQVSDSGTYVCEANDGYSLNNAYVSLTVSPNKNTQPVARIDQPYVNVNEGDPIELTCRVSGVPQPNIVWERLRGQALPYDAQLVDGVLRIEAARKSDSGEYRCLARNPMGSAESIAVVLVASRAPSRVMHLTISPTQPNIQEGQTMQISCVPSSVIDVPSDTLYWSRRQQDSLPENFVVTNGVLYISNALPENSDVYICRSLSDEYIIQPVQVAINIKPLLPTTTRPGDEPGITLQVNQTNIPTGGNAYIECTPRGHPLPLVVWKKYDGVFGPGISQRGNALVISQAQDSDSGYYICEATLPDGTPIAPAYLAVYIEKREKPEVEVFPADVQTVQLGQTFEIYCRVTKGHPEPVVTWTRTNRAMSSNVKIHPDHLSFGAITVNDDGEYVCTASNDVGQSSAGTTISVQAAPSLTITPDNYIKVLKGQPIKVDCRASGYPEPMVYWRKETPEKLELGEPNLGIASLFIDRATEVHEGPYTCFAQSPAGKTQDQISITVEEDYNIEGSGDDWPVTVAPPAQRQPSIGSDSVYAPEGTRFSLNCNTRKQHPDLEVVWSRTDGYPVHYTGESLIFDKLTKQDEGLYQCTLVDRQTNDQLVASQKLLIVERPPQISLKPKSQTVRPGEYALVECVVEGDQPIEVTWQAANGYLSPRVEIRDNRLRFNRIEVEDAGIYNCYASNRVGNATGAAEVIVTDPRPSERVVIERPRGPATVGSDVRVFCRASSPNVKVTWERPGSNGHNQYVDSKNSPGLSVLEIHNVEMSDAGVYRCLGKDPYGESFSDSFVLEVEPAPVTPTYPSLEEKVIEADLGSTINISCTANNKQLSSVEWHHEYGPTLNVTEPVLILHNIMESDAGTYACRWMTENSAIEATTVLKITRAVPMFQGNSWLALLPMHASDIFNALAFEISIKPKADDGIVLYNSETLGPSNDFIALRLINGAPEFQFNSGAGVAILRGDRPLERNKWHTIRVNRNSNKLSMSVDNSGPFTTTFSGYQRLELKQPVYIGGAPEHSQLPDSLNDVTPVGFTGCVSKLILNMEEKSIMRDKIDDSGNLLECDTCTQNICYNDGICQEAQNEYGYLCLCKSGFAGLDCSRTGDACRPGICGPGKCTDTADSYKCTCPSTHRGTNCEISQSITYPAFTGSGYLAFEPLKGLRALQITMKVKPVAPVSDGIIMYCAESPETNAAFTSLAVHNGYLEFRYELDNLNGSTVVRSKQPLKPFEWTEVSISRKLKQISMIINKLDSVKQVFPYENGKSREMRFNTPLYIGGYDDKFVTINPKTEVTGGFNGCIKDVTVFPGILDIKNGKGINVRECSNGAPPQSPQERGDIPYHNPESNYIPNTECQCRNNGKCGRNGICICPSGYYGANCEHRQRTSSASNNCFQGLCQAGGTCVSTPQGYQCECQLGYTGRNCQTSIRLQEKARFQGNGYISLPANLLKHQSGEPQTVALIIRTDQDGVILFQHSLREQPGFGQFLLLRIEAGMVTLNWDMGAGNAALIHPIIVTDNQTHNIVLKLDGNSATLEVDRDPKTGTVSASTVELDVDSEIYIGGIPSSLNWRGYSGLTGCIQQIEFTEEPRALNLGDNALSGVNVDRCWG